MNWSSQPPGVAAPDATAGLPSVMPVAISFGHRLERLRHGHVGLAAQVGLVEAEQDVPLAADLGQRGAVTLAAPQIIGTKLDARRGG